jgi:hypothetical protein
MSVAEYLRRTYRKAVRQSLRSWVRRFHVSGWSSQDSPMDRQVTRSTKTGSKFTQYTTRLPQRSIGMLRSRRMFMRIRTGECLQQQRMWYVTAPESLARARLSQSSAAAAIGRAGHEIGGKRTRLHGARHRHHRTFGTFAQTFPEANRKTERRLRPIVGCCILVPSSPVQKKILCHNDK